MIGKYTPQEYFDKVLAFHGHAAPGVLMGGYLVEASRSQLVEGCLFDVVVESKQCLPDAVQILTPCTIGNGWMRILDHDIYAVVLYDKYTGAGCRSWLDPAKMKNFPTTYEWFYKLKPKKEQDSKKLLAEILEHGGEMISSRLVQMHADFLVRKGKGSVATCPECGEAYDGTFGPKCPLCTNGRVYDFVG